MDHEKTLNLLAKALEIAPGDWETRSHMASLCLDLGRPQRAAELLEAAPGLPYDAPGRLQAAELFIGAGLENAALRIADGLLAENRANGRAHLLKATIFRARGMQADARRHYNLAAVMDVSLEDLEFEAWLDGRELPLAALEEAGAPGAQTGASLPAFPGSPFELADSVADYKDEELDTAAEKAAEFFADEMSGNDDEDSPEDPVLFGEVFDPDLEDTSPDPIQFTDVGGMEEIKERVRMRIVYPFKNRGVFEKFKRKAGGGMLLYGPPGCGKTLIARATAGECGVFFGSLSISDVLSKWFGDSERRLREVFNTARTCRPAVLFIDELDALGVRRSETSGAMSSLVNVLLTEIDDATNKNEELLVISATNAPWRIDSAFRRPGRFDETLFVPPPDAGARLAILEILLRDVPCQDVDLAKIANAAMDFSGADLRALVDATTEIAISEEMRTGRDTMLTEKMFAAASKLVRPSTADWFEQAANYASYANQSGLYDELAEYLRSRP